MNSKKNIVCISRPGKEPLHLPQMLFLRQIRCRGSHTGLRQFSGGYTILEVVVAVVILTISTSVLMSFLVAGDKIFGRNIVIENAALLARNEAEMLKAAASQLESIDDTEYEMETGGRLFYIKRHVLETEALDSIIGNYPVKTVEIQIFSNREAEKPLTSFTLLQGYGIR